MKTRTNLFSTFLKYLYSKRCTQRKSHLLGLLNNKYIRSVNKNNLTTRVFTNSHENILSIFHPTNIDSQLEKFIMHSDYTSVHPICEIVGTYPSDIKTINKKISQMTEIHRVLFGLHIAGYKYEEIAQKMDLPSDSVKKIVRLIVEKLESPDINEPELV